MLEDNRFVISGPPPLQPLPKISLGRLIHDGLLANFHKKQALVDVSTGESISHKEIFEKSFFLASTLLEFGYGQNTVVAICSENNLQFYIPIISCFFMGAVVAPINQNYTESETLHSLKICQPEVVFCSKQVSPKFIQLKNRFKYRIVIIDAEVGVKGAETLGSFTKKKSLVRFKLGDFDPETQVAVIMCSSGTTGLPKGVMLTHTNLMVRYMHTIDPRYVTKSGNFLGVLPQFHCYGLITNFFALVEGQKIILMKKFSDEIFLQTIQNYQISTLFLVSPLVVLLAKSPLVDKFDLSCVKDIVGGAAPLSRETEKAVITRLKIPAVRQGYGLTEATLCVLMMNVGDSKPGSCGKVVSYVSCKVRDPGTGKSLGPGNVGELCFKGPLVMMGYYHNEEATRNAFTSDGWLLTGDLGYYDHDGYFFIVDRLKELIKYKGFQVAPAELEAVILSNPKVQDVGVVGLPDESCGELPVAFVVKKPGSDLTEKEVIDFVAGKVSSQKRLRGGVIFVPAIPKNPSGKILRRELRNSLINRLAKL